MSKNLIDKGYEKAEIHDNILKTLGRNSKDLLTPNKGPRYRIPLTLTYNRTSPNMKETVKKNWNILKINNEFWNSFPEPPNMCFHRNKNLKEVF